MARYSLADIEHLAERSFTMSTSVRVPPPRSASSRAIWLGLKVLCVLAYPAVAFLISNYLSISVAILARLTGYDGEVPFAIVQGVIVLALCLLFWRSPWRWRVALVVALPAVLLAFITFLPIRHGCGPCG